MESKFKINDNVYFISTKHSNTKLDANYDVLTVERGIIKGIVYFENEVCYIVENKNYYIRESEVYSDEEKAFAVVKDSVKKKLESTLVSANEILHQSNCFTNSIEKKLDSMLYLCRAHKGTYDIKLVMIDDKDAEESENKQDEAEELKESN